MNIMYRLSLCRYSLGTTSRSNFKVINILVNIFFFFFNFWLGYMTLNNFKSIVSTKNYQFYAVQESNNIE